MTDKEIKKISKILIKDRKSKSILILLFAIAAAIFFGCLPYALMKLSDFTDLKTMSASLSTYLYPGIVTVVLIALTIWAFCAYSSVSLGEKAWYSGNANRKNNCNKRLFFWFKPISSFKALKFSLILFFIKLSWTIILLAPAIMILGSVISLAYSGGIEFYLFISLTGGGVILMLAGLIFRFIILQRYFLAPYLIASNPKLGAWQSIKQSKNLLDGHIFRIVRFKLSFIPWFISSVLIFPLIFSYPYYKQSCSVIAKEICL